MWLLPIGVATTPPPRQAPTIIAGPFVTTDGDVSAPPPGAGSSTNPDPTTNDVAEPVGISTTSSEHSAPLPAFDGQVADTT